VRVEVASLAAQFRERAGAHDDMRRAVTAPGPAMSLAVTEAPAAPSASAPRVGLALPLPVSPGDSQRRSPGLPGGPGRRRRASDDLTLAGTILGTPLYMAPELCSGAKLALPSSDVFSFGMMAYEVLTRRLPFDKPPLLWSELGVREPHHEPLARLCPGLDPELLRVLEACLARDPLQRPTASALAAAFSPHRAGS
jgi:serine/threonine protein kinase